MGMKTKYLSQDDIKIIKIDIAIEGSLKK